MAGRSPIPLQLRRLRRALVQTIRPKTMTSRAASLSVQRGRILRVNKSGGTITTRPELPVSRLRSLFPWMVSFSKFKEMLHGTGSILDLSVLPLVLQEVQALVIQTFPCFRLPPTQLMPALSLLVSLKTETKILQPRTFLFGLPQRAFKPSRCSKE